MINDSEGPNRIIFLMLLSGKLSVMKKDLSANPWVLFFITCLSLMIGFVFSILETSKYFLVCCWIIVLMLSKNTRRHNLACTPVKRQLLKFAIPWGWNGGSTKTSNKKAEKVSMPLCVEDFLVYDGLLCLALFGSEILIFLWYPTIYFAGRYFCKKQSFTKSFRWSRSQFNPLFTWRYGWVL